MSEWSPKGVGFVGGSYGASRLIGAYGPEEFPAGVVGAGIVSTAPPATEPFPAN